MFYQKLQFRCLPKAVVSIRSLNTQAKPRDVQTATKDPLTDEWASAKPFQAIPGPSKYKLFVEFLPGGRFHNKSLVELNTLWRKNYGDIFLIPGIFGKRDVLFTFQPNDYQTVFRTEGPQPIRMGLDIVQYHRQVHRPEIFKHAAGLVAEQGEGWAHFRTAVNPVMMNPKTTNVYAPKMNRVADEFLELIKRKRDSHTHEMSSDFESYINYWAMDAVCLVALDTELGMINNSADHPKAKAVIDGMRKFFELLFELDLKPSLWKYVATPNFRRVIRTLDELTEISIHYIDEAIKRDAAQLAQSDVEQSVLQRLISIDRTVAIVMAMDMMMAGVDTTTSAMTSCLLSLAKNTEKQSLLREEVLGILPDKHSAVTSAKLKNLPYLRACIKEAFRLYPVAAGNFRTTAQDVILSGYQVSKGVDVAMPAYLLQRDEQNYGRPNEYLPERWLRGVSPVDASGCALNRNVPFVFLPFGFGPRICIGKRIVALELEVTLAKVIRNFEIGYDYPAEGMFKTNIIHVPAKPLHFKFTDVRT
ncbi:cytochrome P450 CYP12A2-like [Anastrepha ludens]|uniref:cytochrome P450 CYP12A2-like n=1 Tax=Anastrepha ludens TaxID=28586 RepID=UPI0023AFE9EF|nr:cytochrome P450 CYP12A2-like [Anastrepha ludens]